LSNTLKRPQKKIIQFSYIAGYLHLPVLAL
jgi:hypothetical protein